MEISKISERIKERRKELNMTQKDLAEAMHVSNQLISKWETGESVPTLEYIEKLSEALQTSAPELMGIYEEPVKSEQSAEPAPVPSAPKEKAPSKMKTFWKKNRKALIISIVSVVAALIVLAVALLSVFVFVPSANKDKYLAVIDKGIDKYFERDYFNIKSSTEVDGDEDKDPDILQGYIDENGGAVYYNSVTDEVVKDKKLTHKKKKGQWEYIQPESIKTVSDLMEELLKTWDDGADDFDLDKFVTYIRKSGRGYYLEFSDEYFFEDLKPSEKKNIKLTQKIKGRVEMDGDITKSIEITVKYRDTVKGEKFSIVGKTEFIQEKPVIEHIDYVETLAGYCYTKDEFLNKLGAVSFSDYLSYDYSISDPIRGLFAKDEENAHYENGYLFVSDTSGVTLFDPQTLTVQKRIRAVYRIEGATVFDGAIWYVKNESTLWSDWRLYRYDLETEKEKEVLRFARNSELGFNGHYFYCSSASNSNYISFVYDLQSQQKTVEDNRRISYVDRAGRMYYYYKSLYIYGLNQALKGTRVIKEENGFVYTKNGSEVYKYEAGELKETIKLSDDSAVCAGNYSVKIGSNTIYDKNGNSVKTFSDETLVSYGFLEDGYVRLHEGKIIAAWNDFVAVSYEHSYNNFYLLIYRLGEWDLPVAYMDGLQASEAKVLQAEDKAYLILYDYHAYNISDIFLFQS